MLKVRPDNFEHFDPKDEWKVKSRYVSVSGGLQHKTGPFDAIDTSIIDGGELFTVSHQNEDYVWGMFVEGIGAFNMMCPIAQVRELTEDEIARVSGQRMVMVGSHTGKVSYEYTL